MRAIAERYTSRYEKENGVEYELKDIDEKLFDLIEKLGTIDGSEVDEDIFEIIEETISSLEDIRYEFN